MSLLALSVTAVLAAATPDAGTPDAFPPPLPSPEGISRLPASAFAYDTRAPLNLEVVGREARGEVEILDVHFKSGPRTVRAYLVQPPGKGPFPGILFAHWLGEPETTSRKEFLDEAVGLAKKGAVSLLVDCMWAQPGWYGKRKHATDYVDAIAQVIDLQRATDALLSRKDVDPQRIAFVGHDFGAMYGVLAGATQPRAKTYVLLASTTTFHEWFLLSRKKPADLDGYLRQMAPLDPVRYLDALGGAPVFLQFAKVDRYISPEKAAAFSQATPEPKLVKIYENTDHSMNNELGLNDRYRWLARELGLDRK